MAKNVIWKEVINLHSFKIINKANELYDYSYRYILNKLPGKAKTFRIALENELYELIHNIYRANINVDNSRIRNKYQKEALVNISTLDLIIGLIGKRRYIKIKRVKGFLGILNDEKKMLLGWIKTNNAWKFK